MPKISVIIPVYNCEKYLRECLDSVVNQTFKDIEIICVDDGSTDSSLEILKEYAQKDNRFIILQQQNKGAGAARNAGLDIARGEYLSFLDSDDVFKIELLEKAYNTAIDNNSDIVYYQYNYYNATTNSIEDLMGINIPCKGDSNIKTYKTSKLRDSLFTMANPMPWNKLIKKDLIIKNGIKFQTLTHSNDIYFSYMVAAVSKKISLLYDSLVLYRYNRENSLRNTRDDNPFCFYEAYKGVCESLNRMGIYKRYKKTFLNSFVSTMFWTYEHTLKQQQSVKEFIINNIIPEFEMINRDNFRLLTSKNKDRILTLLCSNDVIISLTSYPARINTVNQTIESLMNQSMPANKIILWLAIEQFPNKENDLPQQLLNLIPKGLIIDWCSDIRSYKKLIPTLNKYPDKIIITTDDDVIYDDKCIERLYKKYFNSGNVVVTNRGHYVLFDKAKKNLLPYKQWLFNCRITKPSYNIFQTGVGAVLYPKNCFYEDILKEDLFMTLANKADDIWFWAMALLNGVKIVTTGENPKIKYIDGSQEDALWHYNVESGNDIVLKQMLEHYPKLLSLLSKNPPKKESEKSPLECIFSITNEGDRKVFTLFWMKLKIKSKNLEQKRKIKQLRRKLAEAENEIIQLKSYIESNIKVVN